MNIFNVVCFLFLILLIMGSSFERKRLRKLHFKLRDITRRKRNALRTGLWPNGEIPFTLAASLSKVEKEKVCKAMLDLEAHTCIKFIPLPPQNTTTQFIFISNARPGCFANVGYDVKRQMPSTLNLGDGCLRKRGTVEHEMLHVIGLQHEQSRPDRDKYVIINFKNIRNADSFNFDKESDARVTTFDIPYDVNSVMHYSAYAFSVNRLPTIVSKLSPEVIMGQREGPSLGDFLKVYIMYKCNQTGTPTISPFKPSVSVRLQEFMELKTDPAFDSYIESLFRGKDI